MGLKAKIWAWRIGGVYKGGEEEEGGGGEEVSPYVKA